MTVLERYPPSVRKKIALVITIGVGLILLGLMVLVYSHKKAKGATEPISRFRTFYTTILERGQSYFQSI
jgi:hypothetical protein